MGRQSQDKELEQYRTMMTPPSEFADGFTWKTIVGAFFIGIVMMPASMYLDLVVGMGIGDASRWVTIIVFSEIARRSLKELRMQEVYILYYMAGLAMASPFSGLLWNQFFVQSEPAKTMGIAQEIPTWWAPAESTIREAGRTFFTKAWLAPIALATAGVVFSKIDQYGLGYVLYRITNDVEELPFPMAPVGASGIVALTEAKDSRERWRWRCFSIGGMLGLVFGAIYIGVPAVTSAILAKPVQLIPIPFIDFTQQFSTIFPATPMNLTIDLGAFLAGTVIPFWAVIGSFIGIVATIILNPILYRNGMLTNWTPQLDFVNTVYSNYIDFYLSFGVGLTIAVTLVGFYQIYAMLVRKAADRKREAITGSGGGVSRAGFWKTLMTNNVKRGDFSIFIALGIYIFNSAFWISLSCWLVPGFPWPFFIFFALVYTPIISYASAKLTGLCGQTVSIPMIREVTYILSGYHGVKIWFAPAPIPNYGYSTQDFRVLELTGTKISSQIKTQALVIPIVIISSLVFSELLWHMAPVPSDAYPFAQMMWELNAKNTCVTMSSTMEGGSIFLESWRWGTFAWGLGFGVGSFALLSMLGLPLMLFFGLVGGMGAYPGAIIFQLIGALMGRFYFRKKYGEAWLKYATVLLAGYGCGMGLIGMISVSFTILSRMMAPLIF